jgi:hypothetical protein
VSDCEWLSPSGLQCLRPHDIAKGLACTSLLPKSCADCPHKPWLHEVSK